MATVKLLPTMNSRPSARVFEDIRRTRQSDFVNNSGGHLRMIQRPSPDLGKRQGGDGAGALDPKIKEMLYVRGFGCPWLQLLHPLAHRGRPRQGMTEAEYRENACHRRMAAETTGWSPRSAAR